MRALVTGAGGFAGQWLCAELLSDGWDVHGASLTGAPAGGTLEDWQRDAVYWHDADMRDRVDVATVVDAARPEVIFHLAGVSYVPHVEADPATGWSTNVLGAVCLLDAVAQRRHAGALDPVVVIAGSGEQYGAHAESEFPLSEDATLQPASAYAATKVAQEQAALAFWRATGVRVVATRPFNHSGPGQASHFLLPALVQRAFDAIEHKQNTVTIGNPTPVRDYLHVIDVARAYIYLALRGQPGEVYNICSGVGMSVADVARMVLDEVARACHVGALHDEDASAPSLRAVSDPALVRPVDVPVLIGSPSKLTAATTWKPNHTFEMLIQDMVDAAAY